MTRQGFVVYTSRGGDAPLAPMADQNVFEKAEAFARLPRSQASTPFQRNGDTGLWYFADIQTREQTLLAVKDIYDANWTAHIDPFKGETFQQAQDRPGQFRLQSLKSWIERRNTTYDSEPGRRFYRNGVALPDDDPLVKAISDIYRDTNVNAHLKQTERELELYGNVVLMPSFDAEFGEPLLGRYISPRVRVVENQNNARQPYATVLTGAVIERDRSMRGLLQGIADAWITPTPTQQGAFRPFRPGIETKWATLTTPMVPLVHCFDSQPTNDTGYYIDPLGVILAKLNVCINEDFYSRYGYTVLMQAHGQMVIYGHDDATPIEIGPGRAIKFSGDQERRQEVVYANPGADLMSMKDAIEYLTRELREVYGIPASEIDVGEDASGRSRIEARAPSVQVRKAKMAKMRGVETQLLRTTLMVNGAYNKDFPTIPDPSEFDVTVLYAQPEVSLTATDMIALEKHELSLGLVTPGELLMRRKPDAFDSAEEADEWIAANRKKYAEVIEALNPKPGAGSGEDGGGKESPAKE